MDGNSDVDKSYIEALDQQLLIRQQVGINGFGRIGRIVFRNAYVSSTSWK